MPVTCLAVGDPHFQVNNVKQCEQLIERVLATITKVKPDFVVLLGDLLHTHERIHIVPLNLANRFISCIAELVPVFVIIGNHDLINCSQFLTDNHAFNSFKEKYNVTICDKPTVVPFKDKQFVFCPYVPPNTFEQALDTMGEDWTGVDCIFAHQEFYGCSYNPTMKSVEGDIWPEEYPLVVSGHIHHEQRLQENIYYPGTPMQHAFGEGEKKIIALLTFHEGFTIKRIDLELEKKKIVYATLAQAEKYVPPAENVAIKLVIRTNSEAAKLFRKSAKYKALVKAGVLVSFVPETLENASKSAGSEKRIGIKSILQELIKNDDDSVHQVFKTVFEK